MPDGNSCSATSWPCNLRQVATFPCFLICNLHWPVNLPSQAVVRMKWVNAQWEESDHSVHVRGVIGGGDAHGISYSTSTHYLKDLIASCFGDLKVQVPRKVKWLTQDATASEMMIQWDLGSLHSWSGVSGIPHCRLLWIFKSLQMWHTQKNHRCSMLVRIRGE